MSIRLPESDPEFAEGVAPTDSPDDSSSDSGEYTDDESVETTETLPRWASPSNTPRQVTWLTLLGFEVYRDLAIIICASIVIGAGYAGITNALAWLLVLRWREPYASHFDVVKDSIDGAAIISAWAATVITVTEHWQERFRVLRAAYGSSQDPLAYEPYMPPLRRLARRSRYVKRMMTVWLGAGLLACGILGPVLGGLGPQGTCGEGDLTTLESGLCGAIGTCIAIVVALVVMRCRRREPEADEAGYAN
ncbi:hypothetical protein FOMPIDRAFT_1055829 [Fomitopsis schrenkii]|uniref:Uncharacterized protein n=1 Tax=Fomitopsis schrenkii TaxID=2126942 RepID=S8DLF9_FOMSC|nr:hypothetical protein FOMPIDRAFT_1055829 [Fomitopsis schrenkii]